MDQSKYGRIQSAKLASSSTRSRRAESVSILPYTGQHLFLECNFISDNHLKSGNFLCDTGSGISIIFRELLSTDCQLGSVPAGISFSAINNTPLRVLGIAKVTLCINEIKIPHIFFVTNISRNIIGNDFFRANMATIEYSKENAKLIILEPLSEECTDFNVYLDNVNIQNINTSLKLLAAQMASAENEVPGEVDRRSRSSHSPSFSRSRFEIRSDDLSQLNKLDAHVLKTSLDTLPNSQGILHEAESSSSVKNERDERHTSISENHERETENSSSSSSSSSKSGSDSEEAETQDFPAEPLLPSNIVYTYDSIDLEVSPEEKQFEAKVLCDLANLREGYMDRLMNTFPNLYKDEINVTEVPNHDVRLEIVTSGYYKRPFCYRLPEFYHVEAKEKVDNMLSQGILRASSSPYASPMVCAPKKDGTLRVCTDFRHLNDITIADRYVMPRIDDIKRSIRGHVFSTIDLREGFYQIPIEEPDIPKTAMSTPWGLFEYVRMPFGLKNAPATFQRFLNHVTHQLENVSVYIDDLIIFSNTVEEHFQHLFHLFERRARQQRLGRRLRLLFSTVIIRNVRA